MQGNVMFLWSKREMLDKPTVIHSTAAFRHQQPRLRAKVLQSQPIANILPRFSLDVRHGLMMKCESVAFFLLKKLFP